LTGAGFAYEREKRQEIVNNKEEIEWMKEKPERSKDIGKF
jgi:hypothetical protein